MRVKQDALEQGKAEVHQDAGADIFDVDADPDAGGNVADDALCHAVDADGLVGEGVLRQADGSAGEGTGDGAAAGNGKEDDGDEREIEVLGKSRKGLGQEDLQEDGPRAARGAPWRDGRCTAQVHGGRYSCEWPWERVSAETPAGRAR